MISRAVAVLSGGGLTVTGAHNYCGDYLFSGHTIILVMTYMTVAECKFAYDVSFCFFPSGCLVL